MSASPIKAGQAYLVSYKGGNLIVFARNGVEAIQWYINNILDFEAFSV